MSPPFRRRPSPALSLLSSSLPTPLSQRPLGPWTRATCPLVRLPGMAAPRTTLSASCRPEAAHSAAPATSLELLSKSKRKRRNPAATALYIKYPPLPCMVHTAFFAKPLTMHPGHYAHSASNFWALIGHGFTYQPLTADILGRVYLSSKGPLYHTSGQKDNSLELEGHLLHRVLPITSIESAVVSPLMTSTMTLCGDLCSNL